MQQKKRILLLATGGTIASRKSDNGLKPQITPEELIEYISTGKRDLQCRGGSAFKSGQHQHGAVTLETHGSCDLGALRRF